MYYSTWYYLAPDTGKLQNKGLTTASSGKQYYLKTIAESSTSYGGEIVTGWKSVPGVGNCFFQTAGSNPSTSAFGQRIDPTGVSFNTPNATIYTGGATYNLNNVSVVVSPSGTSQDITWVLSYMDPPGFANYNSSTKVITSGNSTGQICFRAETKNGYFKLFYIDVMPKPVVRIPHPDAQNKTGWCWAAAAKMIAINNKMSHISINVGADVPNDKIGWHSYNGIPFYGLNSSGFNTVDARQHQLVVAIHGNDNNQGPGTQYTWVANEEHIIQMAAYNTKKVGHIFKSNVTISSYIATIKAELAAGRWVIGSIARPDDTAHAVVIQSYNSLLDRYYYDPYTNGTHHFFTTDNLTNNKINLPDDEDTNCWLELIFYCN